ncbi:MAG: alcohol dehydrogenase catalytic domain-containing protein, partial [Acidimicrobiia bacterium]
MTRNTMRAAVYYGPRDIRLEEAPVPVPGTGEVLVEVLRSGLCGTDVTEWVAGPKLIPLHRRHPHSGHQGPMIPGHEMVGRVVESDSPDLPPGTLVAGAASVPCWDCDRCREG